MNVQELARRQVFRVTLTPSDDMTAPPAHEIDFSVIGNDVFITVYEGSLDDLNDGRKKQFDVPPINLDALMKALAGFSDGVQSFRYERPS